MQAGILHHSAVALFWVALTALLWPWVLFPALLQLFAWTKRNSRKLPAVEFLPTVTVLITVHNEEKVIRSRIENCRQQDYPEGKLDIIVASDHSTDQTEAIVRSFGTPVRLISATSGRGKSLTQNDALAHARGEIVVFSDADTTFPPDFLRRIMTPFADPGVGCVTGKVLWKNSSESSATRAGDSYWRFEHYLWRLESALGMAFTGSGQCLAFRRELFKPIEAYYGDDTVLPLDILLQKRRVHFEESAIVYDEYFAQPKAELRSRVRMSLRGLTGTLSRTRLFNPFEYGVLGGIILAHKILRYATPYLMLLLVIANLTLLRSPFYLLFAAAQTLFYVCSLVGFVLEGFSIHVPIVSTAYSFATANLGVLLGVTRGVLGFRIFAYRA